MATILIVDDRYENRLLIQAVMGPSGHVVLEAADAEEALAIAAERALDLVLVDLSLSGTSGAQLIGMLRKRHAAQQLRIALYTATAANPAMRDFMEMHGIEHRIPKPCEPEDLLRAIEAALP